MKRIAFVDYKLENFHANVYLKAFRNQLKDRGYEVTGCHAMDEADGRKWAEKNRVPYFADVLKLNDAADFFVVLAPSNPEMHLNLARLVFPFGKPTYVDKTFAPHLGTAKEIFALADQHRTAVQTTSALRYTAVQKKLKELGGREKLRHITTWGGGSSFGEYGIPWGRARRG
jgi:predicted dehydrogenase